MRSPVVIRRIFRAALGDTEELSSPSSPFPALTLTSRGDATKLCESILTQLQKLFPGLSPQAPVSKHQLLDVLGYAGNELGSVRKAFGYWHSCHEGACRPRSTFRAKWTSFGRGRT